MTGVQTCALPISDGRVRVRTFYQSNSQGTWRSASHCGASGWIGKGWGEESTNLPISAQKQLGALVGSTTPTPLEGKDADTAFYGNLPVGGHAPPPSFTDQVNMATFGRFDETMPPNDHGKPETFHYDATGNAPDFSRDRKSTRLNSSHIPLSRMPSSA